MVLTSSVSWAQDQEFWSKARAVLFGTKERPDSLMLRVGPSAIRPAKTAPQGIADYRYVVVGYGSDPILKKQLGIRFRVYDTQNSEGGSRSEKASRLLLRLWDFNVQKLHLDHGNNYRQVVDLYFSEEGKAGGEQRMDNELVQGGVHQVNTIYIYKFDEILKPIEMVREVAHEYGHASLPPAGGFKTPEDWANGYLGERLFMLWLFDAYRSGDITADDVFGCSLDDIGAYLRANVRPLVTKVIENGPDFKLLAGTGQEAMNEYMGLVLYAEGTYDKDSFIRSLQQAGETALGYEEAMHTALVGSEAWVMNTASFVGKKIWIPLGRGMLVSGGKVVQKNKNWAQIQVTEKQVKVKPPEPRS